MTKPENAVDTKLLPCPWCGGVGTLTKYRGGFWVRCVNNGCAFMPELVVESGTDKEAIAQWNTRSTPALPADVQWLVDALEDAFLWIKDLRIGVDKWCTPSIDFVGVDARLENLESWANRARKELAAFRAKQEVV